MKSVLGVVGIWLSLVLVGLFCQTQVSQNDWLAISAPGSPASGLFRFYAKTGTGFCQKSSGGVETCIGSGGSTWPAIDPTQVHMVDEFIGRRDSYQNNDSYALSWGAVGNNPSVSTTSGEANHPGVARLIVALAANSSTGITLGPGADWNSTIQNAIAGFPNNTTFEFIVRPSETTQVKYFVGLIALTTTATDINTSPVNGVFVRYNSSNGCTADNGTDTTWVYESRSASTSTTVNGPALAANSWYRIKIRRLTSDILFSVSTNGGAFSTEQNIATNIPTAAMSPTIVAVACDGVTYKILDVDRYEMLMTGISR